MLSKMLRLKTLGEVGTRSERLRTGPGEVASNDTFGDQRRDRHLGDIYRGSPPLRPPPVTLSLSSGPGSLENSAPRPPGPLTLLSALGWLWWRM